MILSCLVALSSGCGLLPGDPELPANGYRVDNGIVSIYIPLCAGERVNSAEVRRIDDKGDGHVEWRGTQVRDPRQHLVVLDASGWTASTGTFRYETGASFGVDVEGSIRNYGGSFIAPDTISSPLPPGQYDVNGSVMSADEIDAQANCENPG
ncbi:hypothetical protein [Kribbella sp. NPDC048915]|uniref:hypothetical protein n=1 Tax=Kribbella sp. NPDC048915 TaxID=3155148 RepID=UPI00340E3718